MSEKTTADKINSLARKVKLFLSHGETQWILDELGATPEAFRAKFAAATADVAVDGLFDDEANFELWIDTALEAAPESYAELAQPWMGAIAKLSSKEDSLARAFIEDMLAATPAAAFEAPSADGSSWRDWLAQRIDSRHRDWMADIDLLIGIRHSPSLPFNESSLSVKLSAANEKIFEEQSSIFRRFLSYNQDEAYNIFEAMPTQAQALLASQTIGDIARLHMERKDAHDFISVDLWLDLCAGHDAEILKNGAKWRDAMEILSREGTVENEGSMLEKMLEITPLSYWTMPSLVYQRAGCEKTPLDMMAKGETPLMQRIAARALSMVESHAFSEEELEDPATGSRLDQILRKRILVRSAKRMSL